MWTRDAAWVVLAALLTGLAAFGLAGAVMIGIWVVVASLVATLACVVDDAGLAHLLLKSTHYLLLATIIGAVEALATRR